MREHSTSQGGALFPMDFGQREFYRALEGLPQRLSGKESACHAGDTGDMSWFLDRNVYYLGWNRSPAQVGCMRQALGPGALGRPRGIG